MTKLIDLALTPSLWIVALWADYPTPEQRKKWPDAVIARRDPPEEWLIKLSLAKDAQQAIDSLLSVNDMNAIWRDDELRDSGIGFFWMKYESSQIDLRGCLTGAAHYSERFDTSVECESFFSLLRELENGRSVADVARELFEPYRQLAESNWRRLMDV